ncbi:MAG TPA: PEGA domain-containing protein, partial [Candidatus Acidoferrum sp.]|nr:PEGA domain-containing protein [Candidatus Acidoferrum sp.]
ATSATSATSAAPSPASADPQPPPAAAADARVVIRIEPEPADAAIAVDGVPLAGTQLAADRSPREVEIAVSRDGYKTKTRRVSLAESRTVEVILEQARVDPKPRVRRGRHPPHSAKQDEREKTERIIEDSPYDDP